jgi:hypothetical protein
MPDKNRGKGKKNESSGKRGGSEADLQEELNRESGEGGDSVGDVGANRNLTGSSTWETLPNPGKEPADERSPRPGKPSNPSSKPGRSNKTSG